ncbi:MAG: fumarylacetoacetate hydrolase family protein, partial [Nitrososphaeraceae archaeon]
MKIARIRDNAEGETYGLLSPDGSKLVTRSEIQEQTGIPLPLSVKDFMFNEWIKEVIDYQSQLHYSMRLDALELLAPLPNPPTIICLAF